MKNIIVVIIFSLLITGCNKSDTDVEALKRLFNDSIDSLKLNHELELKEKNDEINLLKQKLEEQEGKSNQFDKNLIEVKKNGKTFNLYTTGLEYLEDGIICILEAYDSNNELIWLRAWNGLQVSELDTHSLITIYENKIYIVVSGELNAIDISTGNNLWSVANLGRSSEAPLVDTDGTIYIIGQYKPYLSAISSEGKVLWQVNSDELSGTYSVSFENNNLIVKCVKGELKYDKSGNRL